MAALASSQADGADLQPSGAAADVGTKLEEPDEADHLTLHQAFPIVLPLSSKRVGPKDPRSAEWNKARLQRDEKAAAEWAFRRERGQAQLAKEAVRITVARHDASKAERQMEVEALRTHEREVEIEGFAADRQRQGEAMVYEATIRLYEAKLCLQEVEIESEMRIGEANTLLEHEQAHTAVVEELLGREKERTEVLRSKAKEAEELAKERLAARDIDVARVKEEGAKLVQIAKNAAEERVQDVKRRIEADEKEMQQRLEAVRAVCAQRVAQEKARREVVEADAEVSKKIALERAAVDEDCMRRCVDSARETWETIIERKLERQEKTRAAVEAKVASVAVMIKQAEDISVEAHRRQKAATESLGQCVHVLGHHHACRRRFNVTADEKLSNVVRGKLHESLPPIVEAHAASPSLRALPPRGGLLALHAPL